MPRGEARACADGAFLYEMDDGQSIYYGVLSEPTSALYDDDLLGELSSQSAHSSRNVSPCPSRASHSSPAPSAGWPSGAAASDHSPSSTSSARTRITHSSVPTSACASGATAGGTSRCTYNAKLIAAAVGARLSGVIRRQRRETPAELKRHHSMFSAAMTEILGKIAALDQRVGTFNDQQQSLLRGLSTQVHALDSRVRASNKALATLLRGDHDCPRLLVAEPRASGWFSPSRWLAGTQVTVRFLCAITRAPVGEGYELSLPADWVRSLGPALAISAKVLSHPLTAAVAKATLGVSFERLTLPLADDSALKEMWDAFSGRLKEEGAGEIVDYAEEKLGEAGDRLVEWAEAAGEAAEDQNAGASVQQVRRRLERSYTEITRMLGQLEPGVSWRQQLQDVRKCGLVKAVCADDGTADWVAPRWRELYACYGQRTLGRSEQELGDLERSMRAQPVASANAAAPPPLLPARERARSPDDRARARSPRAVPSASPRAVPSASPRAVPSASPRAVSSASFHAVPPAASSGALLASHRVDEPLSTSPVAARGSEQRREAPMTLHVRTGSDGSSASASPPPSILKKVGARPRCPSQRVRICSKAVLATTALRKLSSLSSVEDSNPTDFTPPPPVPPCSEPQPSARPRRLPIEDASHGPPLLASSPLPSASLPMHLSGMARSESCDVSPPSPPTSPYAPRRARGRPLPPYGTTPDSDAHATPSTDDVASSEAVLSSSHAPYEPHTAIEQRLERVLTAYEQQLREREHSELRRTAANPVPSELARSEGSDGRLERVITLLEGLAMGALAAPAHHRTIPTALYDKEPISSSRQLLSSPTTQDPSTEWLLRVADEASPAIAETEADYSPAKPRDALRRRGMQYGSSPSSRPRMSSRPPRSGARSSAGQNLSTPSRWSSGSTTRAIGPRLPPQSVHDIHTLHSASEQWGRRKARHTGTGSWSVISDDRAPLQRLPSFAPDDPLMYDSDGAHLQVIHADVADSLSDEPLPQSRTLARTGAWMSNARIDHDELEFHHYLHRRM